MSVPIAVTGLTPKRRISSGVIRVPPPMPVMPTIAPIPKPKMMIAGSMVGSRELVIDFLDLLSQKRELRQDTNGALGPRHFPCLRRAGGDRAPRPRASRARGARSGGSFGVRQVDPARADRRPAAAERRRDRGRRRRRARRAARPLRLHAAARHAAALARRDRQRRARPAQPRRPPRRRTRRGGAAVRAVRPGRLRAHPAGRALGRDAPAGRLPAHARRRQAGAGPGRALRRARRDHPGRDAGLARRGPGGRPAHRRPGQPRRRGGALPLRPRRRALGAPGASRRRAERAGAANARPRRRGHRPGLRRRPRARPRRPAQGLAMSRWLPPALVLAALIGLWQVAARTSALADVLGLESFLVPSPAEIGAALWENRSLLAENAWVTMQEILLGFLCGLVAGLSFAVGLRLSATLRRAFYPLMVASQAIPILVIAPILVVWFGFGIGPKLAVVALLCFFPIAVNTADGLRSVDPEASKMMRTLDASRWQVMKRVEAPTALPFVFSGARPPPPAAPIAAVFAEWARADRPKCGGDPGAAEDE